MLVQPFTEDNEDGPARRAGIQAGDVIVKADGKDADRVSTLQRIIRAHEPGETVNIEVMRYGARKSFSVRLGEASDSTTRVASNNRPARVRRSSASPSSQSVTLRRSRAACRPSIAGCAWSTST